MSNIVVTGATSMIGVATIKAFLDDKGVEFIYTVVRPNTNRLSRLPTSNKIKVIYCSIDNYDMLPDLINEKCDLFYHFAWEGTGHSRNENIDKQINNINNSLKALRIAKKLGCTKFIGSGSQAEYGPIRGEIITPSTSCNPTQIYGITKYATGLLLLKEAETLGINCIWVRVFSVYGINDKDNTLVSYAIDSFYHNKETKFTSGEQLWDYLYEDDAGRAFYLIGKKTNGSKIYCLGSGNSKPVKEYVTIIRDIVNKQYDLSFGALDYSNSLTKDLIVDISTLKNDTGFSPNISFKEGIYRIKEVKHDR